MTNPAYKLRSSRSEFSDEEARRRRELRRLTDEAERDARRSAAQFQRERKHIDQANRHMEKQ